jgi:hypothetical protein
MRHEEGRLVGISGGCCETGRKCQHRVEDVPVRQTRRLPPTRSRPRAGQGLENRRCGPLDPRTPPGAVLTTPPPTRIARNGSSTSSRRIVMPMKARLVMLKTVHSIQGSWRESPERLDRNNWILITDHSKILDCSRAFSGRPHSGRTSEARRLAPKPVPCQFSLCGR